MVSILDTGASDAQRTTCIHSLSIAEFPNGGIGEMDGAAIGRQTGHGRKCATMFFAGGDGQRISDFSVSSFDRQLASAVVAQDVAPAIDRGRLSVNDGTCPIGARRFDFPTAICPLLNDSPICSHS